jgi:hypothetical protein
MKLCSKLLAIAIICSATALISCAGPSSFTYQKVALTVTYSPWCACFAPVGNFYSINPPGAGGITGAVEIPTGGGEGGCDQLVASVTNAPLNPTWAILPAGTNTGTLNDAAPGGSNFYCAPSGAPIYSGAQLAAARAAGIVDANGNVVQGTTEIVVTNPADPTNPANVVSASVFYQFSAIGGGGTGPPTGVGIGMSGLALPANVTVPLAATYQFAGYVTGVGGFNPCAGGNGVGTGPASPTNPAAFAVTYEVNGVVGGAGTGTGQFGTINASGLYTAPTAYPSATVHSATVQVISTACPTIISQAATVLLP